MSYATFLKPFVALTLLFGTTIAFAQTDNAVTAPVDPKAAALYRQDPATYKMDYAYSLPWTPVKEKDVLWKKRVWRRINVNEPGNELFTAKSIGTPLATLLVNGLLDGSYKGYTGDNQRFIYELTPDSLRGLLNPALAGISPLFDPAKVTSFLIKEDWLYIESEHRLVGRIIGVAPLIAVQDASGVIRDQPALWFYYPYLRKMMADHKIAGAASASDNNLDLAFEERRFVSKIDSIRATAMPLYTPGKHW